MRPKRGEPALIAWLLLPLLSGCNLLPLGHTAPMYPAAGPEKKSKEPKTVFEWALGKKDQTEESGTERKGNDKSEQEHPDKGQNRTNSSLNENAKENHNGKDEEEEKRLDPDRPHLPEASSTVGLGRAILEGGYTYTAKGSFQLHMFPEALLRVGMFADWLEFRIGQSFASQQKSFFSVIAPAGPQPPARAGPNTAAAVLPPSFTTERNTGAQDLYLGFKFGLTEQQKYLPEMAVIPQMTVPSGSKAFSANEVLPGVNLDMGWEIAKGHFGLEAVLAVNGAVDDVRHSYVLVDHGLTFIYNPTKKLETFIEWDAFYPAGAVGPATGPQHYIVAGSVYYFTRNFELDLRAGVGLNEHANDFLVGSGFAIRY